MNKLALIPLLISSAALAEGTAILNVEGEIQINGQTVINSEGQVISSDTLNIVDYLAASGSKKVTLTASTSQGEKQLVTHWKDGQWKEEITTLDGEIEFAINVLSVEGDTVTQEVTWGNCTQTRTIETLNFSGYTDVRLDQTTTRYTEYIMTELTNSCGEVYATPLHNDELFKVTPIAKTSYQYDGGSLDNCIFVLQENINFGDEFSNPSQKSYRTYCEGVGMVELRLSQPYDFDSEFLNTSYERVTYKLTSVE
ncbi:hypothetical protein [Thaumasiovibrio subtropicus]|uniref:hypothetical protein n=1 Tax=Thaumasiovibrio subtropicus TaxID=1891207 RepID=UPI000B34E26C|nr:hypothetical protein [Thaumasiovibrio subtropicus]